MLKRIALVAGALSLWTAHSALAAAPQVGTVVEGHSVPGSVALGMTRGEVETVYGPPESCQDQAVYNSDLRGLDAICGFTVAGGGETTLYYRDLDGTLAKGSPDDVVYFIRWTEAVSGWTTTAGVNTTLAREDAAAAAAAYPGADVTRNQWGTITLIKDYALGIEILRSPNFYTGTVTVAMAIFVPGNAPPPVEEVTRVTSIELTVTKVKGRREVRALVRVQDETDLAAAAATVLATWQYPDGSTLAAADVTSMSGYAFFRVPGAARGGYTLRIDDVVLDGHRFDIQGSQLEASIGVR